MMKYYLIPLLLLLPCFAHAKTGPYLGADLLLTSANHRYQNQQNHADPLNGASINNHDVGYGFRAGFKGETALLGFIIGQEVFFDQLDMTSSNFNKGARDELTVNNRFGVKVNVGFPVTQDIDVIADLGVTAVDYDNRSSLTGESHGATKAAMLYGIGIYYDITPSLTFRAHYDYQSVKTRYISPEEKDELTLMVGKIGFSVNF